MLRVNISGADHAYEITDNRPQEKNPTGNNADSSEAVSKDETLVFVHGWLLSQRYWQPLVEKLSTRYRCLTYDLRGFGESARKANSTESNSNEPDSAEANIPATPEPSHQIDIPDGRALPSDQPQKAPQKTYTASPYSLAAYAQDLDSLLDSLKIKNAWVLGHSLGGSIALWAAYLFPERIKGVVCINAGGGIYIPKEFEKFRSAGQQMVKFRPSWLQKMPLLPRIFSRAMVKQPLSLQWGQQRIQDFIRADRAAAEGSLLETTTEAEVHLLPQVMGQISQPVHFITATEDSIMPPRYVRYLASFHPQFSESESVSEIANCGHMAMVEQPQAVAEVIGSVLIAEATRPESSRSENSTTESSAPESLTPDTSQQRL